MGSGDLRTGAEHLGKTSSAYHANPLNQADGRLLRVYMKSSATTQPATIRSAPASAPAGPRSTRPDLTLNARRDSSNRDTRRAEADIQDGSYGFGQQDDRRNNGRHRDDRMLYSDNMVMSQPSGRRRG